MPRRKKRRPDDSLEARSSSTYNCPHCGEEVDCWPDISGGEHQVYMEDCAVCCRPIKVVAVMDESCRDFHIEVTAED